MLGISPKVIEHKLNPKRSPSSRIKANPKKVRAVLNMASAKTIKEVQKLTGRIAALNRFISKATDKCLPFFKTLKQAFA